MTNPKYGPGKLFVLFRSPEKTGGMVSGPAYLISTLQILVEWPVHLAI
jgi:hypothetical protein